jgi:iduronate 2-sulfatase
MHTDSLQAKDAEWVLERCARDRERPFFLALGFFRPHTPYIAPHEYFQLHDPDRIALVQEVAEDRKDIPADALASGKKEQVAMSEATAREAIQAYDASISFMDAQVGKVIGALDRLGLSESTMIVFTSDHGYHVGEHGLWQKMSLFEESARVPLLVVMPGVGEPGSVVKTPVSHVDLAPTVLEACGLRAPDGLQGQSLLPMLQDPQHVGRGWALTHVTRGGGDNQRHGYSIRTARWRYTEWDEGRGGVELYDHDADPRELANLAHASHPQKGLYEGVLSELSGMLSQAVRGSFPAGDARPAVQTRNWAPNLTEAAD